MLELSLEGERIVFNKCSDELDSQSIVIITSVGYRKVCLLNELDSYVFDITKKGTYHIEIVNRIGNAFSFDVKISGTYEMEE